MHDLADGHETAARYVTPPPPLGFGIRTTDQAPPFQRMASGVVRPARFVTLPTATQVSRDGHDTPNSSALRSPTGVLVLWIDHRVPFERSASVNPAPELPV